MAGGADGRKIAGADRRRSRCTRPAGAEDDLGSLGAGEPASECSRTTGGCRAGSPARGTVEGLNDWKRTGYGGPCPPIGRHRYFHKLYALDVVLGGLKHPTKAQVEAAMKGHVLAHAELVGTYEKTGR